MTKTRYQRDRFTALEAAAIMRREGQLGLLYKDWYGVRCAVGALCNVRTGAERPDVIGIRVWDIIRANNAFVGTPAERAEYMARWFEAQAKMMDC